MNPHSVAMSRSIEGVAGALAEWTVSLQYERDPSLKIRYGPQGHDLWKHDCIQRLKNLAQALATQTPELFYEQVRWMSESFQARGITAADLRLHLETMRDVIATELPAAVSDPVAALLDQALIELNAHGEMPSAGESLLVGSHAHTAKAYLEAVLRGDRVGACAALVDQAQRGVSVRDLYLHVLEPVMVEVGRLWHLNAIRVSDEHMVTAATHMVMSQLTPFMPRAAANGRTMIAASVGGDLHDIGVRMVADFFEMDGWMSLYLGANTPADDVVASAGERGAAVVALSASATAHVRTVGEVIERLRTARSDARPVVLVGGAPFKMHADLWKTVGADGYATSAEGAVSEANRLLQERPRTTR